VKQVVDTLADVGHRELKKNGIFVLHGFAKFVVVKKPARPARKGINPFTKQEQTFAAKPSFRTGRRPPLARHAPKRGGPRRRRTAGRHRHGIYSPLAGRPVQSFGLRGQAPAHGHPARPWALPALRIDVPYRATVMIRASDDVAPCCVQNTCVAFMARAASHEKPGPEAAATRSGLFAQPPMAHR
jgi:hypothetical protein